ncbi:hypothetical protein RyT2_12210 [Pseudolactococcus yaeyamensis]
MANNPDEINLTNEQKFVPEKPIANRTDMVELLILVVDDLCLKIGALKEQVDYDNFEK